MTIVDPLLCFSAQDQRRAWACHDRKLSSFISDENRVPVEERLQNTKENTSYLLSLANKFNLAKTDLKALEHFHEAILLSDLEGNNWKTACRQIN